jgi:hypothetical protein
VRTTAAAAGDRTRGALALAIGLALAGPATGAVAQGVAIAPAGECAELRPPAAARPGDGPPVAGPARWRFRPEAEAGPGAAPDWPEPAPFPGPGACDEPGSGCLGPIRSVDEPPPPPEGDGD